MVKAIGWCTAGSPAKTVALNPGGRVIFFAASSGGRPLPEATGNAPSWARSVEPSMSETTKRRRERGFMALAVDYLTRGTVRERSEGQLFMAGVAADVPAGPLSLF